MAKNSGKITIIEAVKEIFYALTGTVLILGLMEVLWPKIVVAYINFNLLLVLWLLCGIIVVLKEKYD